MTVIPDRADYGSGKPTSWPSLVDELFRDVPVQSARDLVVDGFFDSDDEVDEFVAHVRRARDADLS